MIAGSRCTTTEQADVFDRKDKSQSDAPERLLEIKIGKALVPAEVDGRETTIELFTMSLGDESIYLAPLKTWSQLDVFKWRVQGKLPGTPAGLEITFDQVKIGGETVSTRDPDGIEKLERAFSKWLTFEREALEQARQKAQSSSAPVPPPEQDQDAIHFEVGTDKAGQPHIRCFDGKDLVADVAVTAPGLTSLFTQGLMKKPTAWKVGALRNWVELDGHLFQLTGEKNDFAALQSELNEHYTPAAEAGAEPDVQVFANPASSSGFDIQFPAIVNGLAENRRHHLVPETLELLSDPYRCRVLRKGIIIKLTPPTLIFKQKLSDGGEQPLPAGPENTVSAIGQGGEQKWIDLSKPVSHLDLGVPELIAIFNHPSLNRRARLNANKHSNGGNPE